MSNIKLLTLAAPLLVLGLNGCQSTQYSPSAQQHESTKHDSATKDSTPKWGYTGDKAPQYWGDMPGHELCKSGTSQSPIDIQKVAKSSKEAPRLLYNISDIEVTNNGHTIVYTPKNTNNTAVINGDVYTLKQFHYHTPSEHLIGGVNYSGEMHYVHANANGELAVIGVMLNPTSPVTTLGELVNAGKQAEVNGQAITVNSVNLTEPLPKDVSYYHYQGSLTTPPCSEGVQWYIMDKPLAVSKFELASFKSIFEANNRPIQPLGQREIILIDK